MHYPTDVSLLWDAVRCLLRETGLTAEQYAVRGWRQWRHLSREVKKLFNKVRSTRRAQRHPERALVVKDESILVFDNGDRNPEFDRRARLAFGNPTRVFLENGKDLLLVRNRLATQKTPLHLVNLPPGVSREACDGATAQFPHALAPQHVERCLCSLHQRPAALWEGEDVDVAVSMVQEAQALYPELRACSFDRGFHSRDNRVRLDALLDVNALPGRGYLSRADREREEEESFVAARRAHPAIESAINGLEHRGLDRVRSHGADGFARTVALSVLAANLHRIGLILQKRERKRQRLVA